jgi:protein O-GlcNAc transferase
MPPTDPAIQVALDHLKAGRFGPAEGLYRQILSRRPNHPDALYQLGLLHWQTGRIAGAIDLIRRAIAAGPSAAYYLSLGNLLNSTGQPQAAIAAFRKAVELQPDSAAAHNDLGVLLLSTGEYQESAKALRKAVSLQPSNADWHGNLGVALNRIDQLDEAMAEFERSLKIKPSADVLRNYGNTLGPMGRMDEAIEAYRQSIRLKPSPVTHSALAYTLHFDPGQCSQSIFDEHRRWAEQYAKTPATFSHQRRADGKLRIGYVSPDFRVHPITRFLPPLLTNHDRAQFEIHLFSDVRSPDEVTLELQRTCDRWHDVSRLNDQMLADRIQKEGIDILVDLTGHTTANRLLMFARRAAPVQVSYLGYPDTTGVPAIDYRLTDAYADPPGATEQFHTERLWRLPRTFLCFNPLPKAPLVSDLSAANRGAVTFGSFNILPKINETVIRLWSQILHEVPTARLLIKSRAFLNEGCRRRVVGLFSSQGISPERLDLRSWAASQEDHLRTYHEVDIALDTFPYNGTTTTCEALWMGVPILTLAGRSHMARVGVSLLSNVGLPELIADSPQEYVRIARDLANDLRRLGELRKGLRERMAGSPLMDAAGFAREIDAAYIQMARQIKA